MNLLFSIKRLGFNLLKIIPFCYYKHFRQHPLLELSRGGVAHSPNLKTQAHLNLSKLKVTSGCLFKLIDN